MIALTISMIRWALSIFSKVKGGPSEWRLSHVPAGMWIALVSAVVLGVGLFVFKPFRQKLPGNVITVAECGGILSDARSIVLSDANRTHQAAMTAADRARAQAESIRAAAVARQRELERLLGEAEERARVKTPVGGVKREACVSADLVRAWNQGSQK